jgi:cysteine synthase
MIAEQKLSPERLRSERAEARPAWPATPLVEATPPDAPAGLTVLAKLESMNPGLSVKDRVAAFVLEERLRQDPGLRGRTFVEASSGNTAVALALAARRLGVRAWLFVPRSAGGARLARIRCLGARLTVTPSADGTSGAQMRATAAAEEVGGVYLDQHGTGLNPMTHSVTTGPEILRQSDAPVDGFAAAVGTGGTLLGVAEVLGRSGDQPALLGAVPEREGEIPGIRRPDPDAVPLHRRLSGIPLSEVGRNTAQKRSQWVASALGHPVGPSSGAALEAALRLGAEMGGGVVATVFPDHGFNYL